MSEAAGLHEKRREPAHPARCDEPHPTEEWSRVEGDERVYYAATCYFGKGHAGPHGCVGALGQPITWAEDAA